MNDHLETAVLGGGCFWCTESVFQALRGVHQVIPGYTGGHVDNPSYEQVCQANTGHVEVIKVLFDPDVISFQNILQVFFGTHDPTTPDQQGGDIGPQYASAIFYQSEQQRQIAVQTIDQVQELIGTPVVTHVLQAEHFWPAESYHSNYYERNPNQGYCRVVISPKLVKLRQHFSEWLA